MKRILEVNVDDKGYGGVFAFVMNVMANIDHKQYTLDICAFEPFDVESHKESIHKYGGQVYECQSTGNFIIKQLHTCQNFYHLLSQKKYQTVHIHSDVAYKLLLYGLVAQLAGTKNIIVHSHSTGIEGRHRTIKKWLQKITKPILSKMHYIELACSELAAEWMYTNIQKVKIINDGISLNKFVFSSDVRKRVRRTLGITKEFLVGTVARFSYQKNPEFLLEIIHDLVHQDNNIKFLWIGSGELKPQIEKKANEYDISDKIIFLGNTDKVYEYYQAMDCFVLPSRFEGLGMVAIEAQAAGLPVIVSTAVPKNVAITNQVRFLETKGAAIWAGEILKQKLYERQDFSIYVKKAGYDMKEEAKKLENLYEVN